MEDGGHPARPGRRVVCPLLLASRRLPRLGLRRLLRHLSDGLVDRSSCNPNGKLTEPRPHTTPMSLIFSLSMISQG